MKGKISNNKVGVIPLKVRELRFSKKMSFSFWVGVGGVRDQEE